MCGPQRPKFGGFWILDFGDFGDFGFWILDFGDFGFWILEFGDFGFRILGILDFGFWGFWILDFGPLCSKSLCAARNAPNLGDFGFWILGILGILDFGFWGFWILDFGFWGFWILDFGVWGFWILDFVTNFGFYIRRRRLCTPNWVGGFFATHEFSRCKAPKLWQCCCEKWFSSAMCLHDRRYCEGQPWRVHCF